MSNHYDFLEVSPNASTAEIEAAVESKFNTWRRLVNHHVPEVVQQANQNLLQLEQIRTLLTNPLQRAQYDLAINHHSGGGVGGLEDPQLVGVAPGTAMAPPRPMPDPASPAVHAPVGRVDAWVCPKCQKANPIGSMYCQDCGHVLGQTCPNCHTSYEVTAAFCPSCGETPDRVHRRRELQSQMDEKKTVLSRLPAQLATARQNALLLDTLAAGAIAWSFFTAGLTLLYFRLRIIGSFWGLLLNNTELSQETISTLSSLLRFYTGLARFIGWGAALAAFLLVLLRLKGRKLNPWAVGGYVALSIIGVLFSRPYLVVGTGSFLNYGLFFPALVAGGIALAGAALLSKYERYAWVGVLVAALMVTAVFCTTSQSSFLSLTILIPMAALVAITGLVGFRAWTVAELEDKRVLELEAENAHHGRQLELEIEGLNQELALLATKSSG